MLPKNTNGVAFTSTTEFNRRVSLYQPGTGSDSEGTPNAPTLVANDVPAKIMQMPNRGKPDQQGQITQAVDYFQVCIRYRSDVRNDWTVIGPTGQVWRVTSTNNVDFANREIRLMCREINGGVE